MRVTIIGTGRWAAFLGWYAAHTGHKPLIWGRKGSKSLENLKQNRKNNYLTLPPELELTDDVNEALDYGELILVAISAQQLRDFYTKLPLLPAAPLVLCMKGLEQGSGLRLTQVTEQVLGGVPVAVWVGPGHPQDFVGGSPNCMVVDSADPSLTRHVADSLGSPLIRFYYGEDIIGTEIGAAAKNVVGLAAGMLDGLGHSSMKGVLMARGAREISRLTQRMGGQELTTYGLCHLGDYEATLFSPHSHNRRYGEALVRGEAFGDLAEGVATTHSLCLLGEQYGVELPICQAVAQVLTGAKSPAEALEGLFLRSSKPEFYTNP